jgi:hypothetical protein
MENKLEYTKFTERLDFAIELLQKKFPKVDVNSIDFMNRSCDIAMGLFVRSEIAYSSKKQ